MSELNTFWTWLAATTGWDLTVVIAGTIALAAMPARSVILWLVGIAYRSVRDCVVNPWLAHRRELIEQVEQDKEEALFQRWTRRQQANLTTTGKSATSSKEEAGRTGCPNCSRMIPAGAMCPWCSNAPMNTEPKPAAKCSCGSTEHSSLNTGKCPVAPTDGTPPQRKCTVCGQTGHAAYLAKPHSYPASKGETVVRMCSCNSSEPI
jgi:hypothetical protein